MRRTISRNGFSETVGALSEQQQSNGSCQSHSRAKSQQGWTLSDQQPEVQSNGTCQSHSYKIFFPGASEINFKPRPCQVNGVVFVPLVVETLGSWDVDAIFHLRSIAKMSASRSSPHPETSSRQLFQRLSVLLQRANAGLIAARAPPPPPPHIMGE